MNICTAKFHTLGMTLMEMLIVIAILGLLTVAILPTGTRIAEKNKEDETLKLMQDIRLAILGPRNSYDDQDNPKLGGYVGDVGYLPKLFVYEWDDTGNKWTHPKNANENATATANTPASGVGDHNAMPVGLWDNSLVVEDTGWTTVEVEDWQGPYFNAPQDDFPDDQPWDYDNDPGEINSENNRRFRLREGKNRLIDGWGRALIIYSEAELIQDEDDPNRDKRPKDLVFVSAGSDGVYHADDPTDFSERRNTDNIVMRITENEWDQSDIKKSATLRLLRAMKTALVGRSDLITDGSPQPNGFIADIGSPEPLVGSKVKDMATNKVYACKETHESEVSNKPPSSYWEEFDNDVTDYQLVPEWRKDRIYFKARPHLLFVNDDYVIHGGDVYRATTNSTGQTPSSSSSYWELADSFTDYAWDEWVNSIKYVAEILPERQYFENLQMWIGWNGPYLDPMEYNFADAWGDPVAMETNATTRDIYLKSDGDGDPFSVTIYRQEYEVPIVVAVRDNRDGALSGAVFDVNATTTSSESDMVDVYISHNGRPGFVRSWCFDNATNPVKFNFNNATATSFSTIRAFDASADPISPTSYVSLLFDNPLQSSYVHIGRHYIIYRDDLFQYENSTDVGEFGSPHPSKTEISGGTKGPPGYQKLTTIHPRTDAVIILGQ